MPTTWTSSPADRWSCSSAGASLFQVFVNAKAKNARTTFRLRRDPREISRPSWERSVNAGARSPTRSVLVSAASFVRPFGGTRLE